RALADHPRREGDDAADARQRGRRLPHAAVGWRRDDVPRAEVPENSDRHGALPARNPRAVTFGRAQAPHRAAPAHRRLDGPVASGEEEPRLRHTVGVRTFRSARQAGLKACTTPDLATAVREIIDNNHYDVAILGGGLAGGCLARQLRHEAPALRI